MSYTIFDIKEIFHVFAFIEIGLKGPRPIQLFESVLHLVYLEVMIRAYNPIVSCVWNTSRPNFHFFMPG